MNINNNIKKTLITKEMLDERIAEIAKQISIESVSYTHLSSKIVG